MPFSVRAHTAVAADDAVAPDSAIAEVYPPPLSSPSAQHC